jgi:antitoxin ParD1/3/4
MVSLTSQQEKWVKSVIARGDYTSTSEVIRHALRLRQEQNQMRQAKLDALRDAVRKGAEEAERGDFSRKTVSEIISESKKQSL